MADLERFITQCVASGGIVLACCSLLLAPFAAWLAMRCILPTLRGMNADPGWQAPLAATAAIVPGALLLVMAATAALAGPFLECTQTITGRVVFAGFVVLTLLSLARATLRWMRRSRDARALIAVTVPASPRLARLAARCGIAVRELPDVRPFCALAGMVAPVSVVSSGTIAQLSDDELCAALLHERGHARRGDQVIAAYVAFATDLLSLPSRELVALYRQAREFGADRHALRNARAHDLASALLTLARGRHGFAELAPLHGEGGVDARLRALLEDGAEASAPLPSRVLVLAVLFATCVAGIHPVEASAAAVTATRSSAVVAAPQVERRSECESDRKPRPKVGHPS